MYEYRATVDRVIDGDTIDLIIDLGLNTFVRTRVRVANINAPERYTDAGRITKAYVTNLLYPGRTVDIRTYKDKTEKYGRWLADIGFGGVDLAKHLVENELASPYMTLTHDAKEPMIQ